MNEIAKFRVTISGSTSRVSDIRYIPFDCIDYYAINSRERVLAENLTKRGARAQLSPLGINATRTILMSRVSLDGEFSH